MNKPLIFDIKRFAINDGPGIRTTIFFKGCPLSCIWCHNPESISSKVQRMYAQNKCMKCKQCINVCSDNAIFLLEDKISLNSHYCNVCEACASVCPTKAIEFSGKEKTVEQIMILIKRETLLMEQSGGGVTFSGGEPLMHYMFLIKILKECGKEGIHRVVDTSGHAARNVLLKVAEHTDLFLYDLKIMDPDRHKKYTGVSNDLILKNLKMLAGSGAKINIRIPLIKNVNDDEDNMNQTASFVKSLDGERKKVYLLPYHNIALSKYEKLNLPNDRILVQPEEEKLEHILNLFKSYGLDTLIGG